MWKKCFFFFFWLCLVREERIWNNVNFIWWHGFEEIMFWSHVLEESCFEEIMFWLHVLEESCFGCMFWRNHVLVACLVTVNCDFILWEFHETFSIITCAGLNLLYGPERANYMMRGGRGRGAEAGACYLCCCCRHPTYSSSSPLPQRHFQSMIVLGSGVLPLPQWSAMSRAETPTIKYSLKFSNYTMHGDKTQKN
jgi:hypothetical protein